MLDVRLFADRRFSAASGAVTVTFFALSGFIFLITQYFQVVRDFGPLSTGARILPVAISIAIASVVGRHPGPARRHPRRRGDRPAVLRYGDGVDRVERRGGHVVLGARSCPRWC